MRQLTLRNQPLVRDPNDSGDRLATAVLWNVLFGVPIRRNADPGTWVVKVNHIDRRNLADLIEWEVVVANVVPRSHHKRADPQSLSRLPKRSRNRLCVPKAVPLIVNLQLLVANHVEQDTPAL